MQPEGRTYEQLIPDLQDAITWFENVEPAISRTRLGHYRRLLGDVLELQSSMDVEKANANFAKYAEALYEANEVATIYRAFHKSSHLGFLRSRLVEAVGGPTSYLDENSSSGNLPRNTAFELIFGAHCVAGGLTLLQNVGTTDVGVIVGRRKVLVECKRLQSIDRLKTRLLESDKQLNRMYDVPSRLRHRGVVAIDITKLLNPNFEIIAAPTYEELQVRLTNFLHLFGEQNARLWKSIRAPKTIAVVLRFGAMGLIGIGNETNLVNCQRYVVIELAGVVGHDLEVRSALMSSLGLGASRTVAPDVVAKMET